MKKNKVKIAILMTVALGLLICIIVVSQKAVPEKATKIILAQSGEANKVKDPNKEELPNVESGVVVGDFPTSRKAVPTVILDLKHLKDIVFQHRKKFNSPDGKHWNSKHTMNLTENSVWYELYSQDGEFIKKLPRYINVDPTRNPTNTDYMADDIHWRWLDSKRIIGVQEIYYRDSPDPYENIQQEMTIPAPHGARIYLLNVDNLDVVYELKCPKLPKGLAIHLDGITKEGYISLSGASPLAYHQGNAEMRNNPKHYQHLGLFQIKSE